MFATAAIDPLTAPQPVLALLFHQARDHRLLVTRHPLEATLQGSLIGAGAPFSASDLEQLDDLLHARQRPPPTLLPPTVLALERDLLLWRLPAAVRPLYLRQGERTLSLMVPWPPLLLAARERTLYVVALRGGRRPTARTPLYHAPLMNADFHGAKLCNIMG